MLKQRIVTALIGVIFIAGVLAVDTPLPWQFLVWISSVLGMVEYSSMFGFDWKQWLTWFAVLIVSFINWWPHWSDPIVLVSIIAVTLLWPVVVKNRISLPQISTIVIGAFYIALGGVSLDRLRALSHGWAWVWVVLISIWMSDTTAFFVGRFIQGPKLWPAISPQKTVSGAVGGIIGAALGASILGAIALPTYDLFALAITGAVISIFGQLGDLAESAYKRSTGVKDSGRILPGHGGILDRIDSLLFAAPFALFIIKTGLPTWFQ